MPKASIAIYCTIYEGTSLQFYHNIFRYKLFYFFSFQTLVTQVLVRGFNKIAGLNVS